MKDSKIVLRARKKTEGLYEVKGVLFYASSREEAIKKYCRRKDHGTSANLQR